MQGNVLGSSSSSAIVSFVKIYQQLTEPSEKSGIWIKSSEIVKNFFYQTDDARIEIEENSLPIAAGIDSTAIGINSDIYLFCQNTAYKYDTILKSYTKLVDIPYDFDRGGIATIGDNIYLFGSVNDSKKAYRYSTIDNTYTKLENIPYNFYAGGIATIGDDIYLFGSYSSDYSNSAYKYNSIANNYTELKNLPYKMSYGTAISLDLSTIIIFGLEESLYYHATYRYNTLNNNYNKDISSSDKFGSSSKINNSIYLMPSSSSYFYFLAKYNAIIKCLNHSYDCTNKLTRGIVAIRNKLYGLSMKKLYKLNTKINNLGDGIYIIMNNCEMYKNMNASQVVDVKKITNGEEQTIEAYIGNGTEWKLLY